MKTEDVRPLDVTKATIGEIRYTLANRTPLMGIRNFGVHRWADVDELTAIALIQIFGWRSLPELTRTHDFELRIITEAEVSELGKDAWYKLLQQGCLALGTAGGPFDDHGQEEKTSATQKVAEFLGVHKQKALKRLLAYINHEDNSPEKKIPDGFSGVTGPMVKTMWRLLREDSHEDEMEERSAYFIRLIKAYIVDQRRFDEAQKELRKSATLIPLHSMKERINGSVPHIVFIRSDSERACAAARFTYNRYLDMVLIVQIKSSGNFQIHSAKKESVSVEQMDEIVSTLRKEMISWANKKLSPGDQIFMDPKEAAIKECQKDTRAIFYYRDALMIFNGSLTQEEVLGLIGNKKDRPLTEETLKEVVISTLNKS